MGNCPVSFDHVEGSGGTFSMQLHTISPPPTITITYEADFSDPKWEQIQQLSADFAADFGDLQVEFATFPDGGVLTLTSKGGKFAPVAYEISSGYDERREFICSVISSLRETIGY